MIYFRHSNKYENNIMKTNNLSLSLGNIANMIESLVGSLNISLSPVISLHVHSFLNNK